MPKKKKTEIIEEPIVTEQLTEENPVLIEEPVQIIDPKKQILLDFKKYWEENDLKHKSRASMEVGRRIWDFWAAYTGRPEKFNGCGSCLPGKVVFLWKEAERYGITL